MSNETTPIIALPAAIAAAFTAWEKDYRADPEGFMSREAALQESPTNYGEACANTFRRYLNAASDSATA